MISTVFNESEEYDVLAIDPSLRSLGYAIVSKSGVIRSVSTIKQSTKTIVSYHKRGLAMACELLRLNINPPGQQAHKPRYLHVVIEVPSNWSTARGKRSKDAESIQKLYYLAGGIVAAFELDETIRGLLYVVTPQNWKGQLPKKIMVERAHAAVPLRDATPHDACEALLLALHALRHRKQHLHRIGEPYTCVSRSVTADPTMKLKTEEWLDTTSEPT